jgi:hypothetical protein
MAGALLHAHRPYHRSDDVAGARDGGKVTEVEPVRITVGDDGADLQGQSGLAHPGGPAEREQPGFLQEPADGRDVAVAPHEAAHRKRQPVRMPPRGCRHLPSRQRVLEDLALDALKGR